MTSKKVQLELSDQDLEWLVLTILNRATSRAARNVRFGLGSQDKLRVDQLATDGIKQVLSTSPFQFRVTIGEGHLDEAPGLFCDDSFGQESSGLPVIELAADPIDGTRLAANNQPGAVSVLAAAVQGKGSLWRAPEGYADKRCIGKTLHHSLVRDAKRKEVCACDAHTFYPDKPLLEQPLGALVAYARQVLGRPPVVELLDRPRNEQLIQEAREAGAIIKLIGEGDIATTVRVTSPDHDVDIGAGIGGSPEGVIAAVIAKCGEGYFEQRPWFPQGEEGTLMRDQLIAAGCDPEKVYTTDELAQGEVMYSASIVTDTLNIPGIKVLDDGTVRLNTIYSRSSTFTTRRLESDHPYPEEEPFTFGS
jgi:fructose-1,6-bisphosphatase/sedoheptulose 1,7-bisphosphatase-like protein